MSLHFIFGRAGTGKTTRCCREIQDYVRGETGRKAFLLVPDQGTYTAEYLLAKSFPGEGFTDVTVCGFSRLAYRVFQELHSPVAEALSPLGQQIIVRRILDERKDELQMIVKAASHPHFSEEVRLLLHQLDLFCVTENDLAAAAEEEGDTPLGRKMKDLSIIYTAYNEYLRSHFNYEGSLFDLLAHEIPKSDMIRHSRIWIDGFNGMAPQKINIVSALIHTAEEVTMTLQMDRPEDAAENTTFLRPYKLYEDLSLRERHSDFTTLTEKVRFHSPRLSSMDESFFARRALSCPLPKEKNVRPEEGLHILRAARKEEEVDAISRAILTLVRDKGFRWRDILVLLRTPDDYTDIFERSFEKYKIAAFIDKKHPMNNHPLVMMTDGLLRFLTAETTRKNSGWQKETIFRLLKTFLLRDFTPEETDRLENYVLSHGIRAWQWHKAWKFREYWDIDAEAQPPSEKELAALREANDWRVRLTSLLDPLASAWKKAKTVREKCALLYQFYLDEKVPDTLAGLDDVESLHTNIRTHLQVWKKMLSLLDEIVHAAGDEIMSGKDFLSLLEDGLSSLTYSTIPPSLDHVTVTGMDRGYAMEARAVFIPGICEGDFPKNIGESDFFTESERQKIFAESRLRFGADLMQVVHQEQFYCYLALTRASDVLYLSLPAVREDGTETEPSLLLTQLSGLGYPSEDIHVLPPSPANDDASFFCNPDQALSLLPSILRESIPEKDSRWAGLAAWAKNNSSYGTTLWLKMQSLHYSNEAEPLPLDIAARLFKPGGRFLSSVTRLENYRGCAYRYFLQYGLGIKERDTGDLQSLDFGNYLHASLHRFGSVLGKENKQWRDATDEDIENLSSKIASSIAPRVRYGALHSDAASRYTENALNKTFKNTLSSLREWSKSSSFDTKALEHKFFLHLRAENGETFTLNGKIDRVDMLGENVAVYDYKTGHTTASLVEIVSGLKLQLLTYLLGLMEEADGNPLLPAALMYIYLSGDVKIVSSVPRNGIPDLPAKDGASGFITSSGATVYDLDSRAGSNDSILPVRMKNDGDPYNTGNVLSKEDFDHLLRIVKKRIIMLYEEMISGRIDIRPVRFKGSSPCKYCPYHSICRFDPSRREENYDYIHAVSDKDMKRELPGIAFDMTKPRKEDDNG